VKFQGGILIPRFDRYRWWVEPKADRIRLQQPCNMTG
jgi:hypothetical protein